MNENINNEITESNQLKEKKPKKILSKILIGLTIFFFALTLFVIISGTISMKNHRPLTIFGYTYSVVPTESMEPNIHVGDIVIAKTVPYEELEYHDEGLQDIIIYYNDEEGIFIVHRIDHFDEKGIITKGDNNPSADSIHVTKDNYIAKVIWNGNILNIGKLATNGKNIIFLLIIVIFFIILMNEVINIFKLKGEKEKLEKEEQLKKQEEAWQEDLKRIAEEELKKEKDNKS